MEKTTRVRKWIPCAVYDVEAMEGWLGDLAAQGWYLEEDGIFGPWAYFLPGPPQPAAYRLTSSLSSPDFTGPEEENQELCAAYGWEYLARRGRFSSTGPWGQTSGNWTPTPRPRPWSCGPSAGGPWTAPPAWW